MIFFRNIIILLVILSAKGLIFTATSQNPRSEGYMGIWYSTGERTQYGYKLSGGFATFGSRHLPTAIYSPEAQKTFFVYGGTKAPDQSHLLIMVSYFDHITRKVPKPVIVYDKEGVRNPYDNASLSIDNNGYIWIFVSGWLRTRPGLVFKSAMPYSTDRFERVMIKEMSFPQPWWTTEKGFLLTFTKMREGLEINFCRSSDGYNWSEDKTITSMGGNGHVSAFYNNKLYVAFNYHPGGDPDKRTNLYLIYTDDYGDTWKTIDGNEVAVPLKNVNNNALIRDFQKEGKLTYIYDINFDLKGDPVLLICTGGAPQPGPSEIPREWVVVKRENNRWAFYRICETDNNFDAAALYTIGKKWIVVGPSEPGPQKYAAGGEMALWESADQGVTWQKTRQITSGSKFNNSYARRPLYANNEFYSWWADRNAYEFSESRIYFTNSRFNKVYMLPFRMKKDYERPVVVR